MKIPTPTYLEKIHKAADYIRLMTELRPKIGLTLGSGLGPLADEITNAIRLDYKKIPHFPVSTVEGHAGRLVIGKMEGIEVIALQGRFHYYEGYSLKEVTFPVRVMNEIGVKTLIVTNACGGLREEFYPGALMFIKDHINLLGDNPFMGPNFDELGPRFPDMSRIYTEELIKKGREVAAEQEIETFEGVYTAVSGPYYLSRAELGMVRTMGSDTIGMSTVPEAIVARHGGMNVLGISAITDMAIPETLEPISHEEVVEVAKKINEKFKRLVKGIVKKI